MRKTCIVTCIMVSLVDLHQLNAMELASVQDAEILLNSEITQKMIPCFQLMTCLEDEGQSVRDASNLILFDLFSLHKLFYLKTIFNLSYRLQEEHNIPMGIELIENLYKTYGYGLAGTLLKIALIKGNVSICAIKNRVHGTCLTYFCRRHKKYPDGIKMILYAAGDEAVNLITMEYGLDESPWHEVIRDENKEAIDIFIEWAISHNQMKELFSQDLGTD